MRPSGRDLGQLRSVTLEPGFSKYAEGSCMTRFGDTHVLCTASVEERVPGWMRGSERGWITAEYGMLPRATTTRRRRARSPPQRQAVYVGTSAPPWPGGAARIRSISVLGSLNRISTSITT